MLGKIAAASTVFFGLAGSGFATDAEKPRDKALHLLIAAEAAEQEVPESLVHRVIRRESGYRPQARNGPFWGLMQIRHDTAKAMGYRGTAEGLLNAETNLQYAVKYLAGAYLVAGKNEDRAIRLYARGYYHDAKRQGLLEEVGLRPAKSKNDGRPMEVAGGLY
jgi:soluble lytic murein transglycosylase-like protein